MNLVRFIKPRKAQQSKMPKPITFAEGIENSTPCLLVLNEGNEDLCGMWHHIFTYQVDT